MNFAILFLVWFTNLGAKAYRTWFDKQKAAVETPFLFQPIVEFKTDAMPLSSEN